MKIAKSYNKQNDVTYVYEILENRWDPVKKRGVPVRRLIGKIDKDTGEIVPTGKRGRPKKLSASSEPLPTPQTQDSSPVPDQSDYKALYEDALALIEQKDLTIRLLESRLQVSERNLDSLISDLSDLIEKRKGVRHETDCSGEET